MIAIDPLQRSLPIDCRHWEVDTYQITGNEYAIPVMRDRVKSTNYRISRACPTNGSDCGSRCSHNLTLFVMFLLANTLDAFFIFNYTWFFI